MDSQLALLAVAYSIKVIGILVLIIALFIAIGVFITHYQKWLDGKPTWYRNLSFALVVVPIGLGVIYAFSYTMVEHEAEHKASMERIDAIGIHKPVADANLSNSCLDPGVNCMTGSDVSLPLPRFGSTTVTTGTSIAQGGTGGGVNANQNQTINGVGHNGNK